MKSGGILILPILASEALVLVYPAEGAEGPVTPDDPDESLGIVVVSLTGSCQYGSFGRKVLEGGAFAKCVTTGRWAQVPCHPARWIKRSCFLLPEVVEWCSILATKAYAAKASPRVNLQSHRENDEMFFFDFLLPYLGGCPQKIVSQHKMIEKGPYGHVRFGLHALLVHGLGLPHVYKRLIVFFQLCVLNHFATYFQSPCGFLASLPQPGFACVLRFLRTCEGKSVVAASRLWDHIALPPCFDEDKLNNQSWAQSNPSHWHRMEVLYDRLLDTMQGVARKLCKMAARGSSDHEWAFLVRSELQILKSKMSTKGVVAFAQKSRNEAADLRSVLQKLHPMQGTFSIPASLSDFLNKVDAALRRDAFPDKARLHPSCQEFPVLADEGSLQWLDAVTLWMNSADEENHLRAVVLFEEAILNLATSGSSLQQWPSAHVAELSKVRALCFKLSYALEAYLTVCDELHAWTALRRSRVVLVAWAIACLQDVLLREHSGDAMRYVLKDFSPPLAAHVLEHLLLPERRWMELAHLVETYLASKASLKHRLLLPGKDGLNDFLALAEVATSHLPVVKDLWAQAEQKARKAETEWQMRLDRKDAWASSVASAIEQYKPFADSGPGHPAKKPSSESWGISRKRKDGVR